MSKSSLDWESLRKQYARHAVLMHLFETNASKNGELNSTVITNIIETFQSIATCEEIINVLKTRFDKVKNSANKLAIEKLNLIRIIKAWFKTQPNPNDALQLKQFIDYVGENTSENDELFQPLLDMWSKHKVSVEKSWRKSLCDLVDQNFSGTIITMNDFMEIFTSRTVAEQLTQIDKELFDVLKLYQCLGRFRNKKKNNVAETVDESVNQFNRVSGIVITSILSEPGSSPSKRGNYIAKWIDIAVQLRLLKNFTSLNAVISALSMTAIKRLEISWNFVPREQIGFFKEMRKFFALDRNFKTLRELHTKEGTARYPVLTENETKLCKYSEKMNPRKQSCGTIPYLGIFLKDLEILDKNPHDRIITDDGLINYNKIKRQADILLQLKYIQTTLVTYDLQELRQDFVQFYKNQPVLIEKDAYEISLKLEPPDEIRAIKRRRKSVQHEIVNQVNPEFYIIKVFADRSCQTDIEYCELKLRSNDRPVKVILQAIEHLKLNGTAEKYDLIMKTNDKELELPSGTNVFYAINPKIKEVNFIIKLNKKYQRTSWFVKLSF